MTEEHGARKSGYPVKVPHILFILISSLILVSILAVQLYFGSFLYVVSVEGREIGLVKEKEVVEEWLAGIIQDAQSHYKSEVWTPTEVVLTRELRPHEEEDTPAVLEALSSVLALQVTGCTITIDGKPTLTVVNEEEVQKVIEGIKEAYHPEGENRRLLDISFEQDISWINTDVHPDDIKDAEFVVTFFLRGTDRQAVYLVSRGDTLSDIAKKHEISIEDLHRANPHLNGDIIQPGQELELIVSEPLLNVITVEEVEVTERIPFSTRYTYDSSMWSGQTRVVSRGEYGSRKVTYRVTRENSQEMKKEKVAETVISSPREQVVARGAGSFPSRGTGQFIWPVQGGGRISQYFHSKHSGLDIVPGTRNILAADSGVVVRSGWDGGYGLSIVIFHGGTQNLYTRYAHNAQNYVSVGDKVSKGQVIALMGSTGRSTGIHLHFEIRNGGIYGTPLNPLNFFRP